MRSALHRQRRRPGIGGGLEHTPVREYYALVRLRHEDESSTLESAREFAGEVVERESAGGQALLATYRADLTGERPLATVRTRLYSQGVSR